MEIQRINWKCSNVVFCFLKEGKFSLFVNSGKNAKTVKIVCSVQRIFAVNSDGFVAGHDANEDDNITDCPFQRFQSIDGQSFEWFMGALFNSKRSANKPRNSEQ